MHTETSCTFTTMTAWLTEWGLAKLRKKGKQKILNYPAQGSSGKKPAA